ncbi:MAG: hypothetical protein JSS09_08860 [Verrucomicrobia bacterium]|nr:hypothetical protein [Verrucomicrobiota bacterium]
MKKKQDKIIQAPVLSLSAKIELFAQFLRKATNKSSSNKKNLSSLPLDTPLKRTVKQVASKKIQTSVTPDKKKKTA